MSFDWRGIGKVAGFLAIQTGLIALDQTIRAWVNHRVKKAFYGKEPEKKEDNGIAVQPASEQTAASAGPEETTNDPKKEGVR